MGKMIGILLVVVGIWLGMEVYLKGTEGALGSALAIVGGSGEEQEPGARRSIPQRAGAAVERAQAAAEARRERLLGE